MADTAPNLAGGTSRQPPARALGALLGFVIGCGFAVLAAYLFHDTAIVGTSAVAPGGAVTARATTLLEPNWSLAPVILIAATIGGWLVGRMAWEARSPGAWVATILVLGFGAVGIGDAIVVLGLALGQPIVSSGAGIVPLPLWVLGGFLALYLLGLAVVGWFAAPFALAAASIWAFGMARLRRRLAAAP
jgi:hypothetical protein